MRNRAKCKLCNEIIESYHQTDYITCKCGEIAISGGQYSLDVFYLNSQNFLRLDDNDKEFPIKVIEKTEDNMNIPPKLSKDDLIEELGTLLKNMGERIEHGMLTPLTEYDLYHFVSLIYAILRENE